MPAVSQKQRAFLNARFGHAWVKRHHFDNKGKLPTYVKGGKPSRTPSAGVKATIEFMRRR